jgi:AbiV family abortive infection protein
MLSQPVVTRRRLQRLEELAFLNALRLHFDSTSLYRLESYPSARLLSIHAQEELGKAIAIGTWLFYRWTDVEDDDSKDALHKLVLRLYTHGYKQDQFAFAAQSVVSKKFFELASKGRESDKQASVYTGFKRVGRRELDFTAPLINPMRVTANQAAQQITWVSDFLIEYVAGVLIEAMIWDTWIVERWFTTETLESLVTAWPPVNRRVKDWVESARHPEEYETLGG